MKKILTTLLGLFGAAVAIIAVCAGILIIFPETNIFGYSFINDKSHYSNEITQVTNWSAINTINLETTNYQLNVVKSDDEKGYIEMNSRVIGLNKSDVKNGMFKISVENDVLTINTVEPSGVLVKVKTYLTVKIPSTLTKTANVNLVVNNANIEIDEQANLQVDNLNINKKATKGSLSLTGLNACQTLEINTNIGRLDLSKVVNSDTNVVLKTRIGSFSLKDVKNLTVESPVAPYITVDNVLGDLVYNCVSGSLDVQGTVKGSVSIKSNSARFNFNKLEAGVGVLEYSGEKPAKSVSLNIDTWSCVTPDTYALNLVDGSLTVKNVTNKLKVITQKGNVTLGVNDKSKVNVDADIDVTTTRGKITVYCNTTNKHYLNLTSTSGEIAVYNAHAIESKTVNEVTYSSSIFAPESYISVYFASFNENSEFKIEGKEKTVNVYLPTAQIQKVDLLLISNKGNINVNLTGLGLDFELTRSNVTKFFEQNNVANLTKYTKEESANAFGCEYNQSGDCKLEVRTNQGSIAIREYA